MEDLEIKIKEKCSYCGGDGIGPDRGNCTKCKGKGTLKKWIGAREFLEKYITHLKSDSNA